MPKELHTLAGCIQITQHHVDTHKVLLMMARGLDEDQLEYRFNLVKGNLNAALAQIARLRQAATEAKCQAVLDLLDERTVPAGHDR